MNGFKDDVISILKTNGVLEKEGAGLIFTATTQEARDLYQTLLNNKFVVVDRKTKPVFNYDYVVIPKNYDNLEILVYALSVVSVGGVIVLQASSRWDSRYVSRFGEFTATKVKYGDNSYIVIKNGLDYGN